MTFNNANRKNIREAEKEARLVETNRVAYTRQIMSDIFGRAWMYDLLIRCNVFHTPFVAGSPDVSAFNCGAQNLGLRLFGDVAAHCPVEYSLMMSEASIKDLANGRRNESSDDADGTESEEQRRDDPESSLDSGGDLYGEDPYAKQPTGSYTVRN